MNCGESIRAMAGSLVGAAGSRPLEWAVSAIEPIYIEK
jgi:hypothetical protein